MDRKEGFQSTHPVRGATDGDGDIAAMAAISIHAPRAGCDSFPDRSIHDLRYFNPRTPCGVRPRYADACRDRRVFQSTHPVRGATACINVGYPVIDISIHAPRAGCDFLCQFPIHPTKIFQSTHPVRGATSLSSDFRMCISISIHAPRAGCDSKRKQISRMIFLLFRNNNSISF